MVKVAALIEEQMDRIGTIDTFDWDEMARQIRKVAAADGWSKMTDLELRRAVMCLGHGSPPPAGSPKILNGLMNEVAARRQRRTCRVLISHYLRNFDPSSDAIRQVGGFLARSVSEWRLRPWEERHRDFALFDVARAAGVIADRVMSTDSVQQVMGPAGIRGDALTAGIGAAAFRKACDIVRERLTTTPQLRDVQLLTHWAQSTSGRFVYDNARSPLAEALLLPWQDPRRDAPAPIKQYLEGFFDDAYGDPRLRYRNNRWQGVSEAARHVRMRWLARAALEHFLTVVDATASEQHQWDYRRAFWGAYIDGDYVSDAWVAFGAAGRLYARELAKEMDDATLSRYGMLIRPYDRTQAVLLLRIGNLIIADWSHNGRVRIWRETDSNAPPFYENEYQAQDLRSACIFERPHLPPAGWQVHVHDEIRRHTRINLSPRDYLP